MIKDSVKNMWSSYLKEIGEDEKKTKLKYDSWYFGINEDMAGRLADLVLKGDKRATTSLSYFYKIENSEYPKVGDLNIITDYSGEAKCIIKDVKVDIKPFKDVDEAFAFTEGEGDKSLKYWREAHIECFEAQLKEYNKEFQEDMIVVCEEFEVVYK